jgi:nucleotide-binding universal stress UspA family protein
MLGLNGGPTDPLVLKLGTEFAKAAKASLVAVHVIEVDWSHELTEETQETTEIASAVLDMAEAAAEKHGLTLDTLLLRARDVGAALVDEAAAIEAESIVLGLPFRKKFGGEFAIGRTVPYVLQNAPCGVIVAREPIATSEARGRGDGDVRTGVSAVLTQTPAG